MNSNMPYGWRKFRTEQVAAQQPNAMATGPFGSSISSKHFVDSGVPVIRGSNLSDLVGVRFFHDNLVYVSDALAKKFFRSVVTEGDLVFTCWGTIGQVGLIEEGYPHKSYVISNKQMKLTPNVNLASSLYLYYYYSSPRVIDEIRSQRIGSSVPGFNLGQLKDFEVVLPPLSEQQRIAAVLGALDDKIELNRQMNRTLEDMAQALFKSWFIDFDGVPESELVDSELGRIPRGWEVVGLTDVAFINPDTLSVKKYGDGSIKYIDISSVDQGVLNSTASYSSLKEAPSRARRKVADGDTLWAQVRPNRKAYLFLSNVEDDWVVSTGFAVLRSKLNSPCHLHQMLIQKSFVDYLVYNATGSAYPAVNSSVFERARVLLPPQELIVEFEQVAAHLRQRIASNEMMSQTVVSVRDALLPRLISGELRVPEAERIVEEVL